MKISIDDGDGYSCRPWGYLCSVCRRLLVVESGFRIYFAVAESIRKTPQKLLLLWGSGGEQGIRTLEQVIARYTISNRAPSASSDNSPYLQSNACILYMTYLKKSSVFLILFINYRKTSVTSKVLRKNFFTKQH